jgi:hypothetical protein
MKNRLQSLTAEKIKADVRDAVAAALGEAFVIDDASAHLVMEVEIKSWGWAVPTDAIGSATETYDFQFMGTARIRDLAKNGQVVYMGYDSSRVPIGMPVVEETCLRAYPKAVEAFAQDIAKFLFRSRP